jgi:cyanate permease
LGVLIGITAATGQLIGALAPYAAGALFDATRSYSLVFLAMIPMLAIAGGVAMRLKPIAPRPPN